MNAFDPNWKIETKILAILDTHKELKLGEVFFIIEKLEKDFKELKTGKENFKKATKFLEENELICFRQETSGSDKIYKVKY